MDKCATELLRTGGGEVKTTIVTVFTHDNGSPCIEITKETTGKLDVKEIEGENGGFIIRLRYHGDFHMEYNLPVIGTSDQTSVANGQTLIGKDLSRTIFFFQKKDTKLKKRYNKENFLWKKPAYKQKN